MERDNRLASADKDFRASFPYSNAEILHDAHYNENKIRIEWDVAWRIFDHVNEYIDIDDFIDINCLDVLEAQNITKQKVYEVARSLQTGGGSTFGMGLNLFCMVAPRPSLN